MGNGKRFSEKRIILHIDMDYFFAQVEERENPFLRGKPVVVGADPKNGAGRGVVSTCNYEARKYNIKSGMPIRWAWERCPQAIFLPVNFGLYGQAAREIMEILKKYSRDFQQVSVDEAYLDISFAGDYEKAEKLGEKIRKEILDKEKLTGSIGIGPNKLIAKISSGLKKPDGLTVVRPEEVQNFLESMDADIIPGIGPKTKEKLAGIGIKTIKDLRTLSKNQLDELFGKWGRQMWERARGIDPSPVENVWERKSLGSQTTFAEDTVNKAFILRALLELSKEVFRDVKKEGFLFKTVEVTIRFSDFQTHTHSKTMEEYVKDFTVMRSQIIKLVWPFLEQKRKVRLVGVRVGGLTKATDN